MRTVLRACGAALLLLCAAASQAADPVYLDELVETPAATLRQQFPRLKREGCFQLANGQFLMITIDKKDQKPWRVALSQTDPCRRAEPGPDMDVRQRGGVALGDTSVKVVEKLGRPDAAADPDAALRKLGDSEYFYICRVSEGCARHTSVFIREGVVTGIAEWYSQ
jgi:hypothetical protein